MFREFLTLGSGDFAARALHAVALLLLARTAGSQAFGDYGIAASIASYGLLAVQQGFDTVATRAAARDPALIGGYAAKLCALRLALAAVVCAASLAGPGLLALFCASYIAAALNTRWAMIVSRRHGAAARAPLVGALLFLAICATGNVAWAVAAQAGGELVAALLLYRLIPRAQPDWDWTFAKRMFAESWPVTISLVLGNMMFNFDVLYLSMAGRAAEVGLYLACYRCLTIFGPVMMSFQQTLLPHLSRETDRRAVWRRVNRLGALAALALAPVSVVLWAIPAVVLGLLYGSGYLDGAPMLAVLAWALPLQAARGVVRQSLYAFGAQRIDTRNLAMAVSTNIALDLILVPRFGALGCAYSTVASEAVLAIATWTSARTEARA